MNELTEQEYKDFMLLLSAFGYRIIYVNLSHYDDLSNSALRPGINVIKDRNAFLTGMVIADEIKQKIYQIIEENVGKIAQINKYSNGNRRNKTKDRTFKE